MFWGGVVVGLREDVVFLGVRGGVVVGIGGISRFEETRRGSIYYVEKLF